MTIKEFLEKNPAAVKEAANCTSVAEFKKLAEKAGITFKNSEEAEKAFETVKNYDSGELSDDDLNAVSGGRAYEIDPGDIHTSKEGHVIITKVGKKV